MYALTPFYYFFAGIVVNMFDISGERHKGWYCCRCLLLGAALLVNFYWAFIAFPSKIFQGFAWQYLKRPIGKSSGKDGV
jgi:hypothetical protein